jgi:hypothetical protein
MGRCCKKGCTADIWPQRMEKESIRIEKGGDEDRKRSRPNIGL